MSSSGEKTEINFSNQFIFRVVSSIVLAILAFKFFSRIVHPLTLIAISIFLAMALNPAVSWVSHKLKSKSRVRATAIAYLSVLILLISFFSLVIPPLVNQTTDFIRTIPNVISDFREKDTQLSTLVKKYDVDNKLSEIGNDIAAKVTKLPGPALSAASRIGGLVISVLTVIVLTFMMLVEGPDWLEKIWSVQPENKKVQRKKIALRMYNVVTNYVNGQLIIAAIAASFALLTLLVASSIFNVTVNAIALAGIIAIAGLIPMIGNMIGATIVVIVCLFSSVGFAITMAVFFLLYQQIENITIQPYVQSKNNELTPLIVFVAALVGIGFGGLLGGLVAIPIAGCLKVLFNEYIRDKRLVRHE